MEDDTDTMQGSDDSGDGDDSLDYDTTAGDEGSFDDQGDDGWDYSADDGDTDNGGDGSDDSGDDGSSEAGTTGAADYSGYTGSTDDGGDQGAGSDSSWDPADQATDSLGSGLGEIGHGAWEAARGLGNAARDLGWGTLDAAGDIAGHFEEAYHGFVDDQPALQENHALHEGLRQAMRGSRENILRDLGIHDGERDPDPERSAGLSS
jgi:hypothetical protein